MTVGTFQHKNWLWNTQVIVPMGSSLQLMRNINPRVVTLMSKSACYASCRAEDRKMLASQTLTHFPHLLHLQAEADASGKAKAGEVAYASCVL